MCNGSGNKGVIMYITLLKRESLSKDADSLFAQHLP